MAGKKRPKLKDFETAHPGGGAFTLIANDMFTSPAWMDLTKGQQLLYVYMKTQYYGAKAHPDGIQERFHFNQGLYSKKLKLYSNREQFRKDRDALISHGFIKCVEDNATTRKSSVYEFSSKWRLFGTTAFYLSLDEIPASMQRKITANNSA